jgi:quaternary ammonium compound-resistance protein SugE
MSTSWLLLALSGVLEAVWATALGRSEGFSRLVPSLIFVVAAPLSLAGLMLAMKDLPTGTAYAVWVGVGATLTVAYSMAVGDEPFTIVRAALLAGIVGCVIGLKLAH